MRANVSVRARTRKARALPKVRAPKRAKRAPIRAEGTAPDRPPNAPPLPRQAAGNAPRTPPNRPSKHHPNRGVTNRRSMKPGVNGSGLSKLARIAKRGPKLTASSSDRFCRPNPAVLPPRGRGKVERRRQAPPTCALPRAKKQGRGGISPRIPRPRRARFAARAQKHPRDLARNRTRSRTAACVTNRRACAPPRNDANQNRARTATDARQRFARAFVQTKLFRARRTPKPCVHCVERPEICRAFRT